MYGVIQTIKLKLMMRRLTKENDFESLLEYIDTVKNYFPSEELEDIIDILCDNPDSFYIYSFVEKVNNLKEIHIKRLTSAILHTDSSHYIKKYLDLRREKGIDNNTINLFGEKLCELKNVSIISELLLTYNNLDKSIYREGIRILAKEDSLKNICNLVSKVDFIVKEDQDVIVKRICDEQDPYYICLISNIFSEYDRKVFVDAMVKTSDPEMLYCFIKYNNLSVEDINVIVDKLCSLGDNKYIYKTLEIVSNVSSIRKKILETIRRSQDVKYMLLCCFHTQSILEHDTYNFDNLYPYMVKSNMYTSQELVDVYKVYVKKVAAYRNKKK